MFSIHKIHISFANYALQIWSNSQGVPPVSIVISLNPMIDCASEFSLLNSLFNIVWISAIPPFELSLKFLIYQPSARYCRVLMNVTFIMLSSITPWASHIAFIMNQNYFVSSFPTPLLLAALSCFPYWLVVLAEVVWVNMGMKVVKLVVVWVGVVCVESSTLLNWSHFLVDLQELFLIPSQRWNQGASF